MKVRRVRVQNYRSIVDSETVDIEDGVTVLIGKNEQGKTNFLKALASFNPSQVYSPADLPNHLRPSLEEKAAADIPVVTIWLAPEPTDFAKLDGLVQNPDAIHEIKCTRFYGNNYSYSAVQSNGEETPLAFAAPDIGTTVAKIGDVAARLKTKLTAHAERLPEFAVNNPKAAEIIDSLSQADFSDPAQSVELIRTFSTALKGLPSQDQAVQEDIASAVREVEGHQGALLAIQTTDRMGIFKQMLPVFVLHSAKVDQIPNEVNIAQFVTNPEATSKGMLNLCRAAGLSTQKIQQLATTTETSRREAYEDYHQSAISGGLNEFWTQERYLVHFRIGNEKLSVSISDHTYGPRIAPSDRSEGFQWYLSFYCSLLSEVSGSSETVLLLDNPGLELHMDGQRDIKRFLEEKMSFDSQIIYVTHSPAMVDPFNLIQLRRIELRGNQEGTKVLSSLSKEGNDFDLLEPVRSAIGMSLVASLVVNDFNVLVEGAADKPILEGAFELLHKDDSKRVLINGSISESKDCLLARFYLRARLPFVVFLDADNGGRELEKELKKWSIEDRQIVKLGDAVQVGLDDFALEDILSGDFYHKAVTEAYPEYTIGLPNNPGKKRANVYEEVFRRDFHVGFSKKRVADALNRLLKQGKADEPSRDNLKKVTTKVLEQFQAQTSSAQPANSQSPAQS